MTATSSEPPRVFSERLDAFLDQLREGETPNHGRFCAACYNPMPQDLERCDHCGRPAADEALSSIPDAVVDMYKRKQKRESVIVNAFAYAGLGLALGAFLGLVAINVLYLDRVLWFYFIAVGVLLIGARLFPAIIGGIIGDEIGYAYANRRLAEDWAVHVAERDAN